ncbi:5-methyltetrahydropteroyltriglutamate-homocysteine S-methyltransferase [Cunninghamella echinulata]|nr:5-methyltetrahydropteroyltriglutamate-homocysteine S-methyltransferase [Cunninghamella echinulata]
MVIATNLGFPYIGAKRELKKLVESYWAGNTTETELKEQSSQLQITHWVLQKEKNLEHIPSGEFTLYDRVLDMIQQFGVIPKRYQHIQQPLDQYFAMARGLQKQRKTTTTVEEQMDVPAMEMKKWFDTNYHYIVPEYEPNQSFALESSPRTVEQFKLAKNKLQLHTRPVLLGPVSFLYLGKPAKSNSNNSNHDDFDPFTLLPKLLPLYLEVLQQLKDAGADWVQIDEPILVLDLNVNVKLAFEKAYKTIHTHFNDKQQQNLNILVATYFGRIENNIYLIKNVVDAIHLDLIHTSDEDLDHLLSIFKDQQKLILSMGIVDGRNIWINDLKKSITTVKKAINVLGHDRIFVGPSCSLFHSPYSTSFETKLKETNPELFSWLAFSVEKCSEIVMITKYVKNIQDDEDIAYIESNTLAVQQRQSSKQTIDPLTRERVRQVPSHAYKRSSPFPYRYEAQQKKLQFPLFPTTTLGSYPQTKEIRMARQQYQAGLLSQTEYDVFIKQQMKNIIEFQEKLHLDILVHGEPERNDMVEHFGHLLNGYAFTESGWVVSYGSRCVKPPVLFGDVSRRPCHKPMIVDDIVYAQSLTRKPMKGMLTGPVTMMKWSFVRDDLPQKELCTQLALALRDEVLDLESAGISCIQVDEPAIREGLPLRKLDWQEYLDWSINCFRLATSGVRDDTQIHTHMCYSDFNDIFDAIVAMDADVISIENSKSDEKLLKIFKTKQYTNGIGPGCFDIHSPRIPPIEEMKKRIADMLKYISPHLIWVNPDCGLKSRKWSEVEASLTNMVEVANYFRSQYQKK